VDTRIVLVAGGVGAVFARSSWCLVLFVIRCGWPIRFWVLRSGRTACACRVVRCQKVMWWFGWGRVIGCGAWRRS